MSVSICRVTYCYFDKNRSVRDYRLSNQKVCELRAAHLAARDAREAYRISAVILLGKGWKVSDVCAALLVDADTVRDYFKRYEQDGLDGLLRMGYVGKEYPICSNAGWQRLSINGAIDVETLSAQVRFDDTIDAASTIALFEQIEQANPNAPRIIVICDNARYYKSKAVAAYLTTSRIQLEPLPPYCPNLNLIERFWKFFKREVLYNRYYETFDKFREACKTFFRSLRCLHPAATNTSH